MTIFAIVFMLAGCQEQAHIDFVNFGEIEPGCVQANASNRDEVARIAKDYFLQEVGVPVIELALGRISECQGKWIVPILAATDQVPTSRTWYVEISRPELAPQKLLRPM
ncbi:MAG TPA: hypothetical protein VFS99_04925 [Xanthomonadaceae bacterium]|nr:hypothetical protein [Xanthomonadaceae bacterium]